MDPGRRRTLFLAILAVVAMLLAGAAAVPLFEEQQGAETPPQIQEPTRTPNYQESIDGPGIPIEPIVAAVVTLTIIASVLQFVTNPKRTFVQILGVALFLGVLLVFLEALRRWGSGNELQGGGPNRSSEGSLTPVPTEANASGFGEGQSNPLSLPIEELTMVVVVVGLFGLVAVFAWRSETVQYLLGADEKSDGEQDDGLGPMGDLAGEAADAIETAPTARAADNAIYLAWSEMVALLDTPDPQSDTPRHFATAAIEAGMDPDDVDVLTQTFEEVRYGDAPLSENRQQRAIAALRRIERTHGSDETDKEWGSGGNGILGEEETAQSTRTASDREDDYSEEGSE